MKTPWVLSDDDFLGILYRGIFVHFPHAKADLDGLLSGLKVRHPKKRPSLSNKSSPLNLLSIFDKTTLQNWSLKRISLPFSQDKAPTQKKTCFIPHGTHLNGAFVRCLGCMGCTALIAERCCWREMLRDPSLSGERSDFCFGLLAFQTDGRIMVPSGRFPKMLPFIGQKVGGLRLVSPPLFFFFRLEPRLLFSGFEVCAWFCLFYLS